MVLVFPVQFSRIVTPGSLAGRRQPAADRRSAYRLAGVQGFGAGAAAGSHRSEPITSRSWVPNSLT